MSSNTPPNDTGVSTAADQLASLEVTDGQADAKSSDTSSDDAASHLEDEELWKPHPPTEECPVCLVPLPLEENKQTYWVCCGKTICAACSMETMRAENVINAKRAKKKLPPIDEDCCSFCRTVPNLTKSEYEERIRKGDGRAACRLAFDYRDGDALTKISKNEVKSLELLHHAADDLGDSVAMVALGRRYFFWEKRSTKRRKERTEVFGRCHQDGRCLRSLSSWLC
jgi:hypothetical protein